MKKKFGLITDTLDNCELSMLRMILTKGNDRFRYGLKLGRWISGIFGLGYGNSFLFLLGTQSVSLP